MLSDKRKKCYMISYTRVPGEVKPTETASRMVLTRTNGVKIEVCLPGSSSWGRLKRIF